MVNKFDEKRKKWCAIFNLLIAALPSTEGSQTRPGEGASAKHYYLAKLIFLIKFYIFLYISSFYTITKENKLNN